MTPELINSVVSQARLLASHSWEYGTLSEALLEWYSPNIAVYSKDAFPGGMIPVLHSSEIASLSYAKPHIWTDSTTLADGEGAAGDPASLGVSAILIGQTHREFLSAAERQVNHLLTAVPRWANGAISHRESEKVLWADNLLMVPPTLAYWAVQTNNDTLLDVAIEQCNLYHDVLGTASDQAEDTNPWHAAGLWQHFVGTASESSDVGIFSSGNGWAATGMSRVLATALHSPLAADPALLGRLRDNIRALLDGVIALDNAEPDEPLLRNYLNDTAWFAESSGTALLAATAYRVAELEPERFGRKYVAWADAKREVITGMIGSDGLLTPVVNADKWDDPTPATASSDAQNFAILLFAAYRSSQHYRD